MTREEKSIVIKDLTAQLADTNVLYVTDISELDAETTSNLQYRVSGQNNTTQRANVNFSIKS